MKHLTFVFIFFWAVFGFSDALAQELAILSGKITSSDGHPVAQASLAIEGTSYGTYSNETGVIDLNFQKGRIPWSLLSLGMKARKSL